MSETPRATTPPAPAPAPRSARHRQLLRYGLFFITAIVLVDAVAGDKGLVALLEAKRQAAAIERALEQARADNDALRALARRLREDPAAIESVARRDLGWIKPGEKVFTVRDITPAR